WGRLMLSNFGRSSSGRLARLPYLPGPGFQRGRSTTTLCMSDLIVWYWWLSVDYWAESDLVLAAGLAPALATLSTSCLCVGLRERRLIDHLWPVSSTGSNPP